MTITLRTKEASNNVLYFATMINKTKNLTALVMPKKATDSEFIIKIETLEEN